MDQVRHVHVIDDEESIRRSIGFLLKTAGLSVEVWPSGAEFLKAYRHVAPGCILLDVRMPDINGLDVQEELAASGCTMPVIILTGHADVPIAIRAMKAGAVDFIEKPFEKTTLMAALELGFARMEQAEHHRESAQEAAILVAGLTGRERDVLAGMAKGLPNKTIAFDLDISPRTVEVYRANLMAKLNAKSLSEALRIAFAARLDA